MKQGSYFSTIIGNTEVKGRISIEKDIVYLCQNVFDGADAEEKYGFKYSWGIHNKNNPSEHDVKHLNIITKKTYDSLDLKEPMIFGEYDVTKEGRNYKFGCGAIIASDTKVKNFLSALEKLPEFDTQLLEDIYNNDTDLFVNIFINKAMYINQLKNLLNKKK